MNFLPLCTICVPDNLMKIKAFLSYFVYLKLYSDQCYLLSSHCNYLLYRYATE